MPNINLDDQNAVDPEAAKYQTMLENLQGNILKGHGRNHTVHVFIKLKAADVKARRDGLGAVAESVVTSAKKQDHESKHDRKRNFTLPGSLFGNVFLTANGYRSLGFGQEVKDRLDDSYFGDGMVERANDLNDPPAKDWEEGYRGGDIDAMILLA